MLIEKASIDYDTNDGNTFFLALHPPLPAPPMRVTTNWTRALDAH